MACRKLASPNLEEGEIVDDEFEGNENGSNIYVQDSSSGKTLRFSIMNKATEGSKDDETEVDRIICEAQEEYSHKSSKRAEEDFLGSDEEEALRLALIADVKKKNQKANLQSFIQEVDDAQKPSCSYEAQSRFQSEALKNNPPMNRDVWVGPATKPKSSWVPLLKRKAKTKKVTKEGRSPKKLPLTVTVPNNPPFRDVGTPRDVMIEGVQTEAARDDFQDRGGEESSKQNSSFTQMNENDINEALHSIRLCVETEHFGDVAKSGGPMRKDNYEQIGMDIVDSDREIRSRPPSTNNFAVPANIQKQKIVGNENDDETEALRAFLLAQVQKNRFTTVTGKRHLEEGEIAGDVSDHEEAADNPSAGVVVSRENSTDSVICLDPSLSATKNMKAVVERISTKLREGKLQSFQKDCGRKRRCERRSPSSDDAMESASAGVTESPVMRRKLGRHRRRKSRVEEDQVEVSDLAFSLEEWEKLIEKETRARKTTERKIKSAEVQRDDQVRRRDQHLERANILSHSIGVLDAEVVKYRGTLEQIRGRLTCFEKERDRQEKALRDAKRAAEKDKKKDGRAQGNLRTSEDSSLLSSTKDKANRASESVICGARPEKPTFYIENDLSARLAGNREEEERQKVVESEKAKEKVREVERPVDTEEYLSSSSSSAAEEVMVIENPGLRVVEPAKQLSTVLSTKVPKQHQRVLPAADAAHENKENVANFCERPKQLLEATPVETARPLTPFPEECIEELRNNPLIMFSGYRLCRTFPLYLITHRAISNKLDPLRPLCWYELFGKCRNTACRWQHESDYVMTDQEVVCNVLAHCPSLCPPDKMFSDYASEILEQQSPKPVSDVVRDLLDRLPDSDRTICACEMAAKCDLPKEEPDEDDYVEYEISPGHSKLILGETQQAFRDSEELGLL